MTIRSLLRAALAAAIATAAPLEAAPQRVTMADGGSAAVVLSQRDLNRIAIEGQPIAAVWARRSQAEITPDPDSGDVFVRPRAEQAMTLYVRAASGATYTLLAVPRDVPGATVSIVPRKAPGSEPPAAGPRALPRIERIKRLVRAMARGEGAQPLPKGPPTPLWEGLETRLVAVWPGDLRGEAWTVRNTGQAELRLDERAFASALDGVAAVAVERHVLAPGAATRALVVRTVEERP